MADTSKNFWLKLQKDFFKRHDIRIIEAMPNGIEIAYLYIKLLAESITHDGRLRFSDSVAYTNEMLSAVLGTDVQIVNQAMDILQSLNLIEVLEDQTIYMTELQNMVGCETKWAEKKRQQRTNRGQCPQNVLNVSSNCPTELEKDIEKDLEKEKELECNSDANTRIHTFGKHFNVFLTDDEYEKIKKEIPLSYKAKIDYFSEYLFRNPDKHYDDHCSTIIKWHRNDVADSLAEMRRAIKERPNDE